MKTPPPNPQYSAAKGAVLGALIGDAAGGVLEFMGRPPTPKEARNALPSYELLSGMSGSNEFQNLDPKWNAKPR